jgi:hypothetical protein
MEFDYLKTIRDQAIFVAAFFSIFGLMTTDIYYYRFGLKYQFLNLSPAHMVYRGFTEIYINPLFTFVLLIILLGVFLSQSRFAIRLLIYEIDGQYIAYAALAFALVLGCYLSVMTGEASATRDMYTATTTLHRLKSLHSKDENKSRFVNDLINNTKDGPVLILYGSEKQISIFQPPVLHASRPPIEVYHVGVSSDDFFSDANVDF